MREKEIRRRETHAEKAKREKTEYVCFRKRTGDSKKG